MADALQLLPARDRRLVEAIAAEAGVSPEAVVPEIVAAFLRMLREVPEAMPRNPLEPIRAGARARAVRQ